MFLFVKQDLAWRCYLQGGISSWTLSHKICNDGSKRMLTSCSWLMGNFQ